VAIRALGSACQLPDKGHAVILAHLNVLQKAGLGSERPRIASTGSGLTFIHYITLQDFNVHGANTTHGTESEVFRGVKREENPQYIELLRRISTVSVLRAAQ
jgi:hypothetical protein